MPRGPLVTDKEKESIRDMYRDGVSVVLIKERTGRSIATIYKLLAHKENESELTNTA